MGTQQGHTGGGSPVPPAQSPGLPIVLAGTPTDALVPTPVDGQIVIDTAGSKIWVRVGGAWKSAAVA